MTARQVLLDELEEQAHPEKVEDVIFWALEFYAKNKPEPSWGKTIAYVIVERIKDEEKSEQTF